MTLDGSRLILNTQVLFNTDVSGGKEDLRTGWKVLRFSSSEN